MTAKFSRKENVVMVSGELSFSTVKPLYEQISSIFSSVNKFTVDLQGVNHCDSASVVLLLGIVKYASQEHASIMFTNIPEPMQILINLYNLSDLISN